MGKHPLEHEIRSIELTLVEVSAQCQMHADYVSRYLELQARLRKMIENRKKKLSNAGLTA